MTYQLTLFQADVSPDELREAERRFRDVLEATLGSPDIVAPVYLAYQRIVGTYGESPDLEMLTDAERMVLEQWEAAESAAVTAVFGPNRYMGDAMFEIRV